MSTLTIPIQHVSGICSQNDKEKAYRLKRKRLSLFVDNAKYKISTNLKKKLPNLINENGQCHSKPQRLLQIFNLQIFTSNCQLDIFICMSEEILRLSTSKAEFIVILPDLVFKKIHFLFSFVIQPITCSNIYTCSNICSFPILIYPSTQVTKWKFILDFLLPTPHLLGHLGYQLTFVMKPSAPNLEA